MQWLRNLIAAGLIAPGDVDDRSIADVQPEDLKGYAQCHFFAGLGGWSHALRLALWPDDRPVWTGSCPCQPISGAGHRKGAIDERHLWPTFYQLISECKPPVLFGEQVAGRIGLEWFAGVRLDLEECGYACGGANLPACSVGAPHFRQRLFFVADSDSNKWSSGRVLEKDMRKKDGGREPTFWCEDRVGPEMGAKNVASPKAWLPRPKDKPEVDGVPEIMGSLRAIGNAIVPQVAAEFIKAFLDAARPDRAEHGSSIQLKEDC